VERGKEKRERRNEKAKIRKKKKGKKATFVRIKGMKVRLLWESEGREGD
jgi:hypothetical protein